MYYPKSQIKTNLVTKGGELKLLRDNTEYQGDYWKTSNGEFFTGKNPDSDIVVPLIPIVESNIIGNPKKPTYEIPTVEIPSYNIRDYSYDNAKSININEPTYPTSHFPTPTQEDYDYGEINRYFLKKTNEYIFIEIKKSTYEKYIERDENVPYQLYKPFKITWDIKGKEDDVYNVNYNTVKRTEKRYNVYGFEQWWRGKFSQLRKD